MDNWNCNRSYTTDYYFNNNIRKFKIKWQKKKIRNRIIISIVIILLLLLFFIPAIIFLLPEDEIIESDNPCDDGIDNDKDGLIDLNDLGCISKEDDTETLS